MMMMMMVMVMVMMMMMIVCGDDSEEEEEEEVAVMIETLQARKRIGMGHDRECMVSVMTVLLRTWLCPKHI